MAYRQDYYRRNKDAFRKRNKARRARLSSAERSAERQREYANAKMRRPLMNIWAGIKARVFNTQSPSYRFYGALGITMATEWKHNYAQFEADVLRELGPRPTNHTLDRKDPEGPYVITNLRWADAVTQATNKRAQRALAERQLIHQRLMLLEALVDGALKEMYA